MKWTMPRKSSNKATDARTSDRHRGGVSVMRTGLLVVLVSAVVYLTGVWLSQSVADRERAASLEREAGTMVSLSAATLQRAVDRERRMLADLAADETLVTEILEAGDVPDVVQRAGPASGHLSVLRHGYRRAAPGATPPVGYALLDMLRTVERDGAPVSPEVHMVGTDRAHVSFVQPLLENGEVMAHLVLSMPLHWLREQLPLPAGVDGQLILEQRANGDQRARVLVLGDQPADVAGTQQAGVGDTRWSVRYSAALPAPSFSPFNDPYLLAVAGGGVVLLGILVLLVFADLRRRLVVDARAWQSLANEVARGGKPSADYPVRLAESRTVLMETLAQFSETPSGPAAAGKTAHGETPESIAKAPTPTSPEPAADESRPARSVAARNDPDLKDLLEGLEVEEDSAEEMMDAGPDAAVPAGSGTTPEVDPALFRAYDIRGVVGRGLSTEVVEVIGRAIGSEAAARGVQEVVVARDGRLSSPELAAALGTGLRAAGRDVIDIGQVPTPVMYFSTYHLGTGSGVVVTGSHNPPDYNGLKIMLAGETLSGDAITALYERIRDRDFVDGVGSMRTQDVVGDYIKRIADDITLHRPLKLVVDCGNGVAGEIAPRVLRALGCEVDELYCEVDGTFPNHHPDPSDPDNLTELIERVRRLGADVGLAFDGDGDRLGVVDASGKIIWPDRQLMLYATDILSRLPGADIIFDVKCSSHLARVITENAGVPVMWRTGHSLIKAKLKESGAPLAGEMSGHIFFNDRWDGFDDGIYTAARLLEILAMDGRSSTDVFADLPETVSTPELKVTLEEGEPPQVIERLKEKARFPEARVTTIDGLRVDFPDGWGLVRASNTTPCLVLRFEADTEEALERIRGQFRALLEKARPGVPMNF